jgi:hypothetical protein
VLPSGGHTVSVRTHTHGSCTLKCSMSVGPPYSPSLVQEYLTWKASNGCLYPNQPPPGTTDFTFNIRTVNIFTLSMTATIPHTDDSLSPVLALVSARYLGNSPHNPSVAVSLKTLEHYRLLHVHKPSFSAEAFAKVICDSYMHPIMYQIWECDQATNFDIIGMSTGQPMSAHIDFSAIDPWADIG